MKNKVNFIFDTETNGFANCSVLSVSFIICKNTKILAQETRYYFSQEKYNYHATKVHGLTKEVIKEKRDDSKYPLYFIDDSDWLINTFKEYNVENIVAHNINFDIKFLPTNIKEQINNNVYSTYCTMKNNSKFVGIKKGNGYKYPSLKEACNAYGIAFDIKEAHSSDYDTLKAYELFMDTIKDNENDNR